VLLPLPSLELRYAALPRSFGTNLLVDHANTYNVGCKEKYLTYRCGYADRNKVGKGHETVWQKDTKREDIHERGECPNGCVGYTAKKPNPKDDSLYWRERIYTGSSGWKNLFYR
jgi:hypothetical protein